MSADPEKRTEPRLAFTLVRAESEGADAGPVWELSAATEEPRLHAWVLDMSLGGMQILAPARPHTRLRATVYDVLVVAGEAPHERFDARARRIWSRDVAHLGQLNGFEFESPQPQAAAFLAAHSARPGTALKWLACQLVAR